MLRNILAVVMGLLTAFVLIIMVEWINSSLYPLPAYIDSGDYESLNQYMQNIPTGSLFFVLMAYMIGSAGGGWVATIISKGLNWPAMLVGSILMGAGIYNVMMISHPLWFVVLTILIFLPASFMGYNFAYRTNNFDVAPQS